MRGTKLALSTIDINLRILTSLDHADFFKNHSLYKKYTNNLNLFENLVLQCRLRDAEALLEAGFKINKQDFFGCNASHLFGKSYIRTPGQLIQFLIDNGADFHAQNKLGISGNDIIEAKFGLKVELNNTISRAAEPSYSLRGHALYVIEQATDLALILSSTSTVKFQSALTFIKDQGMFGFGDYLKLFVSIASPELVEHFLDFIAEYQRRDVRNQTIAANLRSHSNGDTLIHIATRTREPGDQAQIIPMLERHGVDRHAENRRGEVVAIPAFHPTRRAGLLRSNLANEQAGLATGRSWRRFVITKRQQPTQQQNALD